jgi:hypothetical protein
MNRLTVHWDDDVIPTNIDLSNLTEMDNKTWDGLQAIFLKLASYEDTGFEPDEIIKLHNTSQIDVGHTVYVLTRYFRDNPYEVIECTINRKTVITRSTFSVSGKYKNGNWYNGTFVDNSIGKKVFLNFDDANRECERLNRNRR